MKQRSFPKHMRARQFDWYVLDCALRDRETFLQAITPRFSEPDEQTRKLMEETKAEIDAIKYRMRRLAR